MTIIIPIGDQPFFIYSVYKNITETSGMDDVEIYFLTTEITPRMKSVLDTLNGVTVFVKYFEPKHGLHLDLLDWAVENIEFKQDWIYVQHLDVFWLDNNWLKNVYQKLDECIALVVPKDSAVEGIDFKEHKFKINEKLLIRTHDYSGFYNVKKLKKNNLKFKWGKVKDICSDFLVNKIQNKTIKWVHKNKYLEIEDNLDGSDSIGLEISVKFPNKIKELKMKQKYIHCWSLFYFLFHTKIQQNKIIIDLPINKCIRGLPSYSWISSNLFDLNTCKNLIFPWKNYKQIALENNWSIEKNKLCFLLEKYKNSNNVLGNETTEISQIKFLDKTYDFK